MNKLWVRLSLGFSGVVLVAVFIVALTGILVNWASDRFERLSVLEGLVEELTTYYQTQQSWTGSEPILKRAQTIFGKRRGRHWAFFLADSEERVIYHKWAEQIGKPLDQMEEAEHLPIQIDNQIIGYVGLVPAYVEDQQDEALGFVTLLGGGLLGVAVVVGISGVAFGILMSRSLVAPLNSLVEAAKVIGTRNLSQRVEEKGSDEMIAVARAFNEMAADLEQGEQLRRNLLADVAHELRTPLSVLQGNLRAILDEVYPLNQEEMARLYEHTRFLSRLVNDLHELAQAEAKQLPLNLQETDFVKLVRTTVDTFRPSAEVKNITLHTEIPATLPLIQVDAARLTQVLQNLLANALRHTPTGGTITICVQSQAEAICLSIADTGEGIPSEHLPHIFDRFYRIDPARSRDRGGAGLGLAITRAIIEAHRGQISVISNGVSGQGSTFTVQLPVISK